jgi:hypothetical protein
MELVWKVVYTYIPFFIDYIGTNSDKILPFPIRPYMAPMDNGVRGRYGIHTAYIPHIYRIYTHADSSPYTSCEGNPARIYAYTTGVPLPTTQSLFATTM